jgi:hypothetical protein
MAPVVASSAITWLFGVVTNITPLLTIGADSWTRASPVSIIHSGLSLLTLPVLIFWSGL